MSESGQPTTSPAPPQPVVQEDLGGHDVFLSYASQDAAVANEVVAALERHRLSCWIAPRDVAPGALYADEIIAAINGAKVMILVLSQHSVASPHVGKEIERASAKRRPIVTLRVDATPLTRALEYFLSESQWIDLGLGGLTAQTPKLVEAVRRLCAGPSTAGAGARAGALAGDGGARQAAAVPGSRRLSLPLLALGLVVAALIAYIVVDKFVLGHRDAATAGVAEASNSGGLAPSSRPSAATTPAAAPPPHSIAVLPFVNMSGDPKQDYFSDGLSEELLNSLSAVPDLHVAAQTSSFSFKGKNVELADIARKLNVGAILEGSVRREGQHVRVTAQLVNASTGFDLWAHTYDRDLTDVLRLQADVAAAVTTALQATLLADTQATIELGGTVNPKAFDAYLRAKSLYRSRFDKPSLVATIADADAAIQLDPQFAKAYALKASAENFYAEYYGVGPEIRIHFDAARKAAERAVQLAPDLGEAHSAVATVLQAGFLDFRGALAENERALSLAPNDAYVLRLAGLGLAVIGRGEEAVRLVRRSVALDQVNPNAYALLSRSLSMAHRYAEAVDAANQGESFEQTGFTASALRGLAQEGLGEYEAARQSCEHPPLDWQNNLCLAIAYQKLNRQADAQAQVDRMQKDYGEATSYQYAEIYAQWGDIPKSLEALEAAYRLRDPGLAGLKTDEFLNPLRAEPRFKAILAKLDFPD